MGYVCSTLPVDGSSLTRSPGPVLNQTDPKAISGTPGLPALVAVRSCLVSGVVRVPLALMGSSVAIGVEESASELSELPGVVALGLHAETRSAPPSRTMANHFITHLPWRQATNCGTGPFL